MQPRTLLKTSAKIRLNKYSGEWVALVKGKVAAHSRSLQSLMMEVASRGLEEKVSVFLVPRKDEGPYVGQVPIF